MTQDEIIRMAREAGMTVFVIESLERFAALVAARERVRTKDLTDDELASACGWKLGDPMYEWVVDIGRWAIAADREKNRG